MGVSLGSERNDPFLLRPGSNILCVHVSPFQITRPRSDGGGDVAKGHEGRSSAAKINTEEEEEDGGKGSHSNFIIWTAAAADGRKRRGKDEQVEVDGGDAGTIGGWGIDGHFNFARTPHADG